MVADAIFEIARRYNIAVEVSPVPLKHEVDAQRGIAVFMGAGLSLSERKVWFGPDSGMVEQLHELAHIITHPPGTRLNMVRENFMLMQVERELARDLFPRKEFRAVVEWQQETSCSDEDELFDIDRPYWQDEELWLGGYRRAKEVGLLRPNRRPTYELPRWPADPVKWYFDWMTQYDVVYKGSPLEELRG